MNRPKVSVFLAVSLDGYIAGDHGDLSWLMAYSTDSPESTGYADLMNSVETIVLGRNSYEVILGFDQWLYEGKTVIILTHRSLVPAHGETAYDGTLDELLRRLGNDKCRHVYLDGGQAARQGLQLGVVDELTIHWVPVILGRGVPLFTPELSFSAWRLIESAVLPSGLLRAVYVPEKTSPDR